MGAQTSTHVFFFFNKQAQSFRWISVKSLNICNFYHSALQCVSLLLSEWNRHRLSIFALYGKCWRKTFLRRLLSYIASLSCVKVSVVLTHPVCFLSSSPSKYDSNMMSISIDSALAIVFELWMLHWASKHLNTLFMLLLTVVSGLGRGILANEYKEFSSGYVSRDVKMWVWLGIF